MAIVRDATPLACGASAGSCSAVASVADLVGYGTAADYEGSGAAPAIDNTTAAARGGGGCTDTDANATDFTSAAPTPRNSSTAAITCGTAPPPTGRRLAERDGGRRHPAGALDRARAVERQLRQRDDGRDARRPSPSG